MQVPMEREGALHIGQYIDCYLPAIDGVVLTVSNYARLLNEKHANCYVVTAKAPKDHVDTEEFPIHRYESMPLPKRPPYRFGVPSLDLAFERKTRYLRPDLVHAHSPFTAGYEALRVARARNVPIVASFHSKYYDDALQITKSEALARQTVKLIVAFYARVDAVWSVNESTASTLREYGYDGQIQIMPNGCDYQAPQDIQAAKAYIDVLYGLSPQDKLVLYVGQHIEQKNLPALVRACAMLKQRGLRFRLLSIGEGYAMADLKALALKLDVDDRIVFAGKVADRKKLCKAYARADLFAFPSTYDNAPLVVREAAMAGCPSLLVAGSNAAEGTSDCQNAFHCEPTPEGIADGIEKALSDEERRLRIGQNAKASISRPWEDIVDEVYRSYEDILKNYRARHGGSVDLRAF